MLHLYVPLTSDINNIYTIYKGKARNPWGTNTSKKVGYIGLHRLISLQTRFNSEISSKGVGLGKLEGCL